MPVAAPSGAALTWIERKRSARSRFASAVRSRSPMNWSFPRVSTTRTPSSSCRSAATRRAMSSVSSFSWSPLGPDGARIVAAVARVDHDRLERLGPGAARRRRARLAVEVEHHARRILQPEHLAGGRRALEGHPQRGGAARLAELGGRHQPVADRTGACPASRAHVRERHRQPAFGLDQPGLDRRIRLQHEARVGRVRADAQLDAGRGRGGRADGGARAPARRVPPPAAGATPMGRTRREGKARRQPAWPAPAPAAARPPPAQRPRPAARPRPGVRRACRPPQRRAPRQAPPARRSEAPSGGDRSARARSPGVPGPARPASRPARRW